MCLLDAPLIFCSVPNLSCGSIDSIFGHVSGVMTSACHLFGELPYLSLSMGISEEIEDATITNEKTKLFESSQRINNDQS